MALRDENRAPPRANDRECPSSIKGMKFIDLSQITIEDVKRAVTLWKAQEHASAYCNKGNGPYEPAWKAGFNYYPGGIGAEFYLHAGSFLKGSFCEGDFRDANRKFRRRAWDLAALDTPDAFLTMMRKRNFAEAERAADLYGRLLKFLGATLPGE